MGTNFPTSLDTFTNPSGADGLAQVDHAAQHGNANAALEAVETKVGVNGSTDPTSLDYRVAALEANPPTPTDSFAIGGTLNPGWDAAAKIIEIIAAKQAFIGDTSLGSGFGRNIYFDGTNFRYAQNGAAAMILMTDSTVTLYSAVSGNADDVVTPIAQWQSNLSDGKLYITQDASIQGVPVGRGGSRSNLLTTLRLGTNALSLMQVGYGTIAAGDDALSSVITSYRNYAIGNNAFKLLQPAGDAITSVADAGGGVTRFFTPSTHNISAPCNFNVLGTTSYNGSLSVIAIDPDVSFDVSMPFVADETGTWYHTDGTQGNVGIGQDCAQNFLTGSGNTIVGDSTANGIVSGTRNTLIGSNINMWNQGSGNTLLGNGAGNYTNWDGSVDNNICINSGGADRIIYNASAQFFKFQPTQFFYAQGALNSLLNPFAAPGTEAWGMDALKNIPLSAYNSAFGREALKNLTTTWGSYTSVIDDGGNAKFLTTVDLSNLVVGHLVFAELFTGSGPYAGTFAVLSIDPGVGFTLDTPFTVDHANGFADVSAAFQNCVGGTSGFSSLINGSNNTGWGANVGAGLQFANGNTLIGPGAGGTLPAGTAGVPTDNHIIIVNGLGNRASWDESTQKWDMYGGLKLGQDNTATIGDVTLNKPSGRVNVSASASTITVTNSFVSADSLVIAVVAQDDATAQVKNVVAGSGSFVINLTAAATANTAVNFVVIG